MSQRVVRLAAIVSTLVLTSALGLHAQGRFLGKADITIYGLGLKVEPAVQTVPKGFATIVSTFIQGSQAPGAIPPFAPGAEVHATLRGPSFAQAIDLVAAPNTPFNIPMLTVPGTHTLENIRLVSGGDVVLYGTPETARIEVIDKLLVTTVTARPLTAAEIREKGIVFDKENFQAFNFTAAFAIDDGSKIDISFPVVLPTLLPPKDASQALAALQGVDAPLLKSLETIIPDTLRIQSRIPNLSVVGLTLTLDDPTAAQNFFVPPIPGVIVIPGDIGFLNQFFSVMLMVANVAPTGSSLVVSELNANIVLPPGKDNVVGSTDDPLAMARDAGGETPRIVPVTRPGPDGVLGTGDDLTTLGPGETGNAEFLVEGKREGTHVVEMELAGTLNGLPIGPAAIRGRAAGVVLVRNPEFTLTFTHPDVVNIGEPYTLDVTVTNTSESLANFVSLNLFSNNISGARLDDDPSKSIESIAPGDSASVTYRLISNRTGKVTAATLDSDQNVSGIFQLKTAIGELGVPLSPDSLVLPKEASSLPPDLRNAALGLLGRAWAVATAPPAVFPQGLTRFSKQVVLDRGVETAEAGFRLTLGEPLPTTVSELLMDYLGSEYTDLALRVPAGDTTGLLALLQADVQGFDLVRRRSARGDVFADAIAKLIGPSLVGGPTAFHRTLAGQFTSRPGHVSIFLSAGGSALPIEGVLLDPAGMRTGGLDGTKVVKDIPFSDVLTIKNAGGEVVGQLFFVAVPASGDYTMQLARRAGASPTGLYDVSIAYPGASGGLQFASFSNVGPADLPTVQHAAADPSKVLFALAGNPSTTAAPGAPTAIADPPPTVLGAFQIAEADMVGCPQEELGRTYGAGRVIAILFSEAVTPESVQDKLRSDQITAFIPEGNRVVGVALQPGGRIAFLALREPFGPLVPRTITIDGVTDRSGQAMVAAQTVPIVATVPNDGGIVSGRILNADGTPAAFTSVRLFYEFQCAGDVEVVGIAEEVADASGHYQFDYVLNVPGMTVRLLAIDEATEDLRTVRFRLARSGQHLNVDVVFLGRGTLKGRTLAEDGHTLLPDTQLRITSATDQSQYGATSDATGAFEVARVPVGNLLIEAVNVQRGAQVFVSERIPFAGAVVTRDIMLLDVDTTGATVKYGAVTGRVLRADGVTPVGNLPVVAYYRTGSQAGIACPTPQGATGTPGECAVAVVNADADGLFAFPSVPAGDLRLNTFDQAALMDGTARIALVEGQTFDVSILIAGGFGTVTGVVLDASGHPVADAVVGGGLSLANVNPADGTFTLTDVPVGRREIVAVSQALESEGRTTIDLVQQGETVNATIVLESFGAIAGVVRNHTGVPQPGIKVWVLTECFDELLQPSVCIQGEATTDASGAYRINGLKVGTYTVSAFTANLKDGNLNQFAIRFNRQVLINDITFRGGFGAVNGRVLRACPNPPCADTPLPAKVAISGDRLVVAGGQVGVKFERVQNYKVVDNDFTTGAYSFSDVWTGPFTVRAAGQFSPEPVAAEGEITGPGQTVTLDLRLLPTSSITGTVFEPDGFTPVTNRSVALKFASNAVVVFCTEDAGGFSECQSIPQGIQEAFAATDSQGRFSFPLVNAGPFTITATDDAQVRTGEISGSVRAGETLDLSLRLLGRSRVTVRVFGSDGTTPIPNASVDLKQIDFRKETRSGLAINGTVTFEGADALSEGQFVVTAIGPGGFAGRASGRVIADNQDVVVDVFLFNATGTVAGLVTREDPTAGLVNVPNAEVLLSIASGPIAFTVTDAQGAFSIPLVPTGPFTVEAFDPVTASRGRAAGTVVGGPTPAAVNIRLEALGSIKGTVVENGTLAPLKGWTVQLSQTTPSGRPLPAQISQTGVDGSFTFPGAAVGSFFLSTSRRGVVGEGTASGQLIQGGQLVDVPIVVTIERRVTGKVSGLVAVAGGAPAPNAQVEVCPSGESCRATTADSNGRFLLQDIPLGRFTARATAQVSASPSVGTTGGSVLFEDDTADVTITLLSLSTIDGTVFELVNGSRVPAAATQVRLFGQPGSGCPGVCQQSTNSSGQFHFSNVPATSFTVSATGFSGQQGSVGGTLNPGELKSGLEIVLSPAVSLRGRVLLANGDPAGGVVAELSLNGTSLFAETDATGLFQYESVNGGAYDLLLRDPIAGGLARKTGTVLVTAPIDLGDIVLDEAPPMVALSTPANGAQGIARSPEIRVTFTERVNAATVSATSLLLIGPSGPLGGQIDLLENDTVGRFRLLPGSLLADQTRYSIKVTGVQDLAGRSMNGDFTASFTTLDLTPPSIVETTPPPAATGVTIDTTIRVRYSEIIDPSRFTGPAIVLTGPSGPIEGRVDYAFNNSLVIFTPLRPLAEDALHTVQVARATDLTGLQQASGSQFLFSTTDRTPPVVTSLVSSNNGVVIEGGIANIAAQVAPSDVAVVDFFINDVFAFADRLLPFELSLQAASQFGEPGSRIKVSAVATDTSGNRGTTLVHAFVDVIADQPPTVSITQPAVQVTAPAGQRIDVQVSAADDVGVTQVAYVARGTTVIDAVTRPIAPAAVSRTEAFAFNVPLNAVPGSTISIEATVVDTKSHVTQATPVLVRVLDAIGPQVQITGVSSGQRVRPGQEVTVVVQADDVGLVAQVGLEISGLVVRTDQRAVTPARATVATSFLFTVPANATSTDSVTLRAFAIDAAGNRANSSQTTLPVADQSAPTVAITTPSGSFDVTAGQAASVIVEANDDVALATVRLTATGPNGFVFDQTQSVTPTGTASATFVLQLAGTLVEGNQIALTARAVDASGNTSTPVTGALTVRQIATVTLPTSLLLEAGQQQSIDVTLGAPAPAGGVQVDLASRSPGVAGVTAFVQIAAGQTTVQATVTAIAGGQAQIDASIGGTVRQTMTVTVAGGIVRGTVLVMAGQPPQLTPAADVQVTLFHAGAPLATTSDANGTFFFAGVVGAGFGGRDFSVRASDGTLLGFLDATLSVPGGHASVNVVLIAAGAIEGVVNLADGTTRVGAGVQVDLFEAASPAVAVATTFTDALGQFTFPLAAPGPYRVDAADQQGNRARQDVIVVSGATTQVSLSFVGRGTVTGTVKSGANQPVANAIVELNASSLFGNAPLVTTSSDVNGRFSFANVLLGSVTVLARDQFTNQAGAVSGQLSINGQTLDLTVVLSSYGNLRGTVKRADGVTVAPGAAVNVKMANAAQFNTTADTNGEYAFEFLPFMTFTVTARDAGSRGIGIAQGGFGASGETVTRDVQLLPQGALLVTVNDANGVPINGATVSAQTQAFGLVDSLQGVTTTVNGQAGRVLLDKLLAGSFSVSAVASGLSGGASGQLAADEVLPVTITLEPTATIQGLVLDQDGQTPASGVVRIHGPSGPPDQTLINGHYTATLRLGQYSIEAFDLAGRRRAVSGNITLSSNGEVQTHDLTFVAIGTVSGRVIHAIQGGDAGNLTVSLRSFHPVFGGFASAQTDAAGNYAIGGVPVGDVLVTSSKPSEQLIGEANGTLIYTPPAPAALSLDIQLRTNAVNLPTTLNDGNGSNYSIAQAGGLASSTGNVFVPGSLALTLTPSGGPAESFTGATFGTFEGDTREVAVRQNDVAGLNVTRKVFVPASGYFARYLEVLSNPTAQPITVDVDIASRVYGGFNQFCSFQCERTHFLQTTSSGDQVIDVTSVTPDHWFSLGGIGPDPYTTPGHAASLGFVFDGPGAAVHASQASYTATNPNVSPFLRPLVSYGWHSVSVPAGGAVTLMHFVSIQGLVTGATASADRLVQLPPEALDGLSQEEIATIPNFAVPANGASTIAALPAITGTINGRVLEGDGTSGVPGAIVLFKSSVPVHPRTLQFGVDGNGNFSFTGASGGPVPLASFTLSARHPVNQFRVSPTVTGDFTAGQTTATRDVIFSDGGILTGVLRRPNGTPVAGAFLEMAFFASTTTAANGTYRFPGVPAGTHTLRGSLSNANGTALSVVQQQVVLTAGETRDDVVLLEASGSLTGILTDANGVPQLNRFVSLAHADGQFTRTVQTDGSLGRFTFTDVRVGSLTLSSVNPANNFAATKVISVTQDQTTNEDLAYQGNVTLNVLVTRASGTPIGGIDVAVSGTGFSVSGVTAGDGTVAIANVPVGVVANVLATHPALSNLLRASTSIPISSGSPSATLALPAFGTVAGQVTRPNGTLAGFGVMVQASATGMFFSTTTDNNSQYSLGPIPIGLPFTLRAQRPTLLTDGSRPNFDQTLTLTTDGQVLAGNTHYPAVSQLTINVTENGSPLASAPIHEVLPPNNFPLLKGNTAANGTLVIAQIVEGSHVYRVTRPSTTTVIETAVASIVAADDAGNVNLNIEVKKFTISIQGTILDADGAPMANPQPVNLYRAGDRQFLGSVCVGGTFNCASGAPGQFTFTQFDATNPVINVGAGIATGAGVIVQVRSPFVPFDWPPYEQTLVPTQDGVMTVTFNLPFRRATVQGRVLAADGTTPVGVGAVSLNRFADTSTRLEASASVNSDGTWSYPNQFFPTEGVRAKLWNVTGVTNAAIQAVTAPITSTGQVVSADLILPPTTVYTKVTGRVVAGDGVTALEGASVTLAFTQGTCSFCTTSTNAQGQFNYELAIPANGEFSVKVQYDVEQITQSFTSTTQGAVVDAGTIALPLSILSGTVTYGASVPAPSVQIVILSGQNGVAFPGTDQNGEWRHFGLAPGTYTVRAEDNGSGNTSSATVDIPSAQSSVRVDLQLPPVGNIVVRVFDPSGTQRTATRVALTRPETSFSQICNDYDADANGECTFEFLPMGDYYVQAIIEDCDQGTGQCTAPIFASRVATLSTANETRTIDLRFAENGQVMAITESQWDAGIGVQNGEPIRLTLRAMGAGGSLGNYERDVQVAANPSNPPTYLFTDVPPGRFVLTAEQRDDADTTWEALDRLEGELPAGLGAPFVADFATTGNTSGFNFGLAGNTSTRWIHFIGNGGETGSAHLFDGSQFLYGDSFSYANRLQVSFGSHSEVTDARVATVKGTAAGNHAELGPFASSTPVYSRRKLFVPDQGGFLRYLDTLTNDTDVPVRLQVTYTSSAHSDLSEVARSEASATTGGMIAYATTYSSRAAFGLVFAGPSAPEPPSLNFAGGFGEVAPNDPLMIKVVTVPPHSAMSFMNFVVMREPSDTAGVLAQANALMTLSDPNALADLTQAEIASIVNFRFTEIHGQVMAGDGTTPIANAPVELAGGACQPCTTQADATGNFTFKLSLPAGDFTLSARSTVGNSPVTTQSFTSTGAATFDAGALTVAAGVVSGTVAFAPSTPASGVSVTLRSGTDAVGFAGTNGNGQYQFVGVAPGTYTVDVRHAQSSYTGSVQVVVASASSHAIGDVLLPPANTVVVRVFDRDGSQVTPDRVALTHPVGSYQAVCGTGGQSPEQNGECRFDLTPVGDFYAQAAIQGSGAELFASGIGAIANVGETAIIDVRFADLGEVLVRTDPAWVLNGSVTLGTPVRLTLRTFGANGPLGTYQREVVMAASDIIEEVLFEDVPPGPLVLTADWQDGGGTFVGLSRIEGTLDVDGFLELDMFVSSQAGPFPFSLTAGTGFRHVISPGGETVLAGHVESNGSLIHDGAFSDLNVLTVNGDRTADARAGTLEFSPAGNGITMGPFATRGPVHTTRRVFMPEGGTFTRYLDVFSNDSDVPVTVRVDLRSKSNTPNVYEDSVPSNAQGGWVVYDGTADDRTSVGLAFSGPGGALTPTLTYVGGNVDQPVIGATFTLAPHSRAALMHFVVIDYPSSADPVSQKAHALVALIDPEALTNLSQEERDMIINFVVPPQ